MGPNREGYQRPTRKGAELGHVLLLNTNRKLYMRNSAAPLNLTFEEAACANLKGQSQCHTDFEDLFLAELN